MFPRRPCTEKLLADAQVPPQLRPAPARRVDRHVALPARISHHGRQPAADRLPADRCVLGRAARRRGHRGGLDLHAHHVPDDLSRPRFRRGRHHPDRPICWRGRSRDGRSCRCPDSVYHCRALGGAGRRRLRRFALSSRTDGHRAGGPGQRRRVPARLVRQPALRFRSISCSNR